MTFDAAASDMTIVEFSRRQKIDAVLVRRHPAGRGTLQHAEQIKFCNDCCNSELGHALVCWS